LAPVKDSNGSFIGVIGLVLKAEYFSPLIANRTVGESGYAYMADGDGTVLAHPKQDFILKLNSNNIPEMADINKMMQQDKNGVAEYRFKGTDKIAGFAPVGINGWDIAVTQDKDEFLRASFQIQIGRAHV
jgi:methyl-accepting chemotaxis protein